jgi:hypothetical protein
MHQRLTDALNALGDTAEKVGQTLYNGGWHGQLQDSSDCPVARYLTAVLPDASDVAVGSKQARVHTADCREVKVDLTPVLAGFVFTFDVGLFPELVVEDATAPVPDI